ncbi:unnamed protein product [Closterium sp. NIES-53]
MVSQRRPTLPVAPPCCPRAALLTAASPCPARRAALLAARRPAGCRAALSRPRTALLAAAPPFAARAPPCWQRAAPFLPSHRPTRRAPPFLPARRPAACPHAALLAARCSVLPTRCPALPYASVLTFDPEGCSILFDTWLDDLQLYLLSDSRDNVSLFGHTPGASLAPPDTAASATHSQWLTRDDVARLAVRNHLPLAKRAHFGKHKTAKTLYDVVFARYSSPATAALGRLILPYFFPELSAFATVEDLITHLRTSDTRYRAALKAEFLDKNPPPMDHFLALDPTDLTVDILEKHLLAAETSIVDVGAARGTPRTPFFDGCSPSPLAPSYTSTGVVDILGTEEVAVGVVAAVVAAVGVVVAVVAAVGVVAAAVVAVGVELFRGECYLSVPLDPSIEAAALGASEFALLGSAPVEALHTFALESGASRCFFCDSTTLTPLPTPVPVRVADPSRGPVLARSTTVLPCPTVPSGSLSGLHLPSFSTNLVSTAALQDAMVTTTTPGGQRVAICTFTWTGRHLATFTRRPMSSLYTLTTELAQVATSSQVSASGQVAAPCSCRLLLHQTLLWHHRLGHPSLPRLRGMHSRLLVSGLPRSLPPLPPSPVSPCLPCVEGRQRAAPHSSSFPPMTAPLHTLHMDAPRPLRLSVPAATTAATATAATTAATAATAAPACCTAMASCGVLAFDHEGRPVQFDTWLVDLQLYLLRDFKDSVSLFDLASGAAPAPPATADNATRSHWLTRDAATRLAIRNHLPLAKCADFGQHRTAQALYAAVVARYSSPATAALGRLLLPSLFPELSAIATVEDLVSHLRTSDARYRATVPTEFLDRNQPSMFITLYFIVNPLPDSLRSVRDHFLSLDPTSLTVDLLEKHLLAAETSAVAVGAARGTPRPPFFVLETKDRVYED